MKVLEACCEAVVKRYLELAKYEWLERPGIALFCPTCRRRIEYRERTWQLERTSAQEESHTTRHEAQ